MSSKIKVDTIENVAGSGNVSLGSGHNLVVPGNNTTSGNATVGGTLGVTGTMAGASTLSLNGVSAQTTYAIQTQTKPIYLSSTDTTYANVTLKKGAATTVDYLQLRDDSNNLDFKIDSEGRVTIPNQPNFLARPNGNDTIAYGGSKIAHDEAIHNIGNHYNTSNQRFTAPVAGIYYFEHIIVMTGGNTGTLEAKIYVNGAERSRSYHRYDGNQDSDRTSRTIELAAADYVEPYCHWSNSSLNTLNAGSTAMMITSFSGYLMQ